MKTLDERQFFSTIYFPEFGTPLTSGQIIAGAVAAEFECHVDDTSSIETDDGEEILTAHGKPVARVIKTYGWRT